MTLVSYKFNLTKPLDFKTAVYGSGDAFGKKEQAVEDARKQLPLQPKDSIRAKIYALQESMHQLPEVECKLQHLFAPGVYMRTIHIPAGTAIVGKIHKHKHGNILSKGRVSVMTEAGGVEHLEGPIAMVSEPGTKRALIAHTDLVWTTIHQTETTDLAELEKELIAETYADYEQFLLEGDRMKQNEGSK